MHCTFCKACIPERVAAAWTSSQAVCWSLSLARRRNPIKFPSAPLIVAEYDCAQDFFYYGEQSRSFVQYNSR